jgi:hypothetical protein
MINGLDNVLIGNYTDVTTPANWQGFNLMWGTCTYDTLLDFVAANPTTGEVYERAEKCIMAGNIGALQIGGGSTWNLGAVQCLDNQVWDHTGAINYVSGRGGTWTDNRNTAHPTFEVPQYVALTSADVGPLAP